jgi:hypothetical protein
MDVSNVSSWSWRGTGRWTSRPAALALVLGLTLTACAGGSTGSSLPTVTASPIRATQLPSAATLPPNLTCEPVTDGGSPGDSTVCQSVSASPLESSAPSHCPWSDIYQRCLPPVDPSVEPISLSHPSTEAAAALDRCIYGRTDVEVVAGGRIAHARDAWQYVPVPRNQREIQSDEAMWLIQLRGQFIVPTPGGAAAGAGVWQDPLCMIRKGESGYIGIAGPGADASGMTRSLPTPAP